MADDNANKNTVDKNNQLDPLEAELDAAIASIEEDDDPVIETRGDDQSEQSTVDYEAGARPKAEQDGKIKVTSPRDRGKSVPVSVEPTKRRKLNEMLELMSEFTHKEVKQIVKVDKRRRKAERLQGQNMDDLSAILGK